MPSTRTLTHAALLYASSQLLISCLGGLGGATNPAFQALIEQQRSAGLSTAPYGDVGSPSWPGQVSGFSITDSSTGAPVGYDPFQTYFAELLSSDPSALAVSLASRKISPEYFTQPQSCAAATAPVSACHIGEIRMDLILCTSRDASRCLTALTAPMADSVSFDFTGATPVPSLMVQLCQTSGFQSYLLDLGALDPVTHLLKQDRSGSVTVSAPFSGRVGSDFTLSLDHVKLVQSVDRGKAIFLSGNLKAGRIYGDPPACR